ncbi:MAG: glutamate-1-semialdehyde 2,1-aminomutase [Bacteroidetes bacterium]|nr:MAG: glutamate-1-semialdehyde 2,1-aminomutase [Bacteroidota bacterium]
MRRDRSSELFEKAKTYFPGGVNSPVRAFRSVGGTPLFIERGSGSRIWDADGNEFIDYCCSWGPLILGHAHPEVKRRVIKALDYGTSFGAPTALENDLAELIISNHRFIEKIRFVSSGTEAVMSALRLARGITGRSKILKFEGCYHGHTDAMLVKAGSGLVTFGTSSSAGVPEAFAQETIVIPLDSISALNEAFEKHAGQIAAVIIEPIPANNGLLLQSETFLRYLREICTTQNTLLIFDEVISGFRAGFTGAAGLYDIQPDIITFGKIIGGGLPVGAYASSAKNMAHISPEGNVYQAGTLSGNPVAMSAGIAQLSECLKPGFYEELERKTVLLCDGISNHARRKNYPVKMFRTGSIWWIAFTTKEHIRSAGDIDGESMNIFKVLHAELLERGIYLGPSGYEVGFVSSAHTDADIHRTISAFEEALDIACGK